MRSSGSRDSSATAIGWSPSRTFGTSPGRPRVSTSGGWRYCPCSTRARQGVDTPGVVTLLLVPLLDAEHPDTPEPDRQFLAGGVPALGPTSPGYHRAASAGAPVQGSVGVDRGGSRRRPGAGAGAGAGRCRGAALSLAAGRRLQWHGLAPRQDRGARRDTRHRRTGATGSSGINEVLLGDADGNGISSLSISGLELPRLLGIAVSSGSAAAIADLRGETSTEQASGLLRLPVPAAPEEC